MIHPKLFQALIGGGLLIGGLALYAIIQDGCSKRTATTAEIQAAQAKGEANARQKLAKEFDAKVRDLQAKIVAKDQDNHRLHAERDEALRNRASKPKPVIDPISQDVTKLQSMVSDLSERLEDAEAVIAKDAEVIESQVQQIATVKESLTVALQARDEWRATAEARERQADAQEAATKAWKQAVTSSRWRGRIEGFAAGAALGFLGGRR